MVTDKKLVLMYEQCRKHKKELDKRRYLIRAVMFMPPALTSIFVFLSYLLSIVTGAGIMLGGGSQIIGDINPLIFIHALVVAVFTAGEVVLETKDMIDVSHIFYPCAAIAALIFGAITGMTTSGIVFIGFFIYDMLLCIVNIVFKNCYAENQMLKTLDGYPHFNVALLSQNEEDGKVIPKKSEEEIAEMSDDERLMYERDRNI